MTLQWLVCAKRPLDRHELSEALSITPNDTCLHSNAMVSEDDLLTWCSSLIRRRADGMGIELAHFTVKEYLVSTESDKDLPGHQDPRLISFKIRPKDSDKILGQVCLTYLNMEHLEVLPPDDLWDNVWSSPKSDIVSLDDSMSDNDSSEENNSTEDENDIRTDSNSNDRSKRTRETTNFIVSLIRLTKNVAVENEVVTTALSTQGRRCKETIIVTANEAFQPHLDKFPLLAYAATQWSSHLKAYMMDTLVSKLFRALFSKHKSYRFIWWSYAYSSDVLAERWLEPFSDATTLHWAAILSAPELCYWLIDEGSDANRMSQLGTPLDCALCGQDSLFLCDEDEYLCVMMENDELRDCSDLQEEEYDREMYSFIKGLLHRGAKLSTTPHPSVQVRPLGLALISNPWNHEIIQMFLDEGAPITEEDFRIVDQYITGIEIEVYMSTLPSGLAMILSESVREHVLDSALPNCKQVLTRLAENTASHNVPDFRSYVNSDTEISLEMLQTEFLQAAMHGTNSVIIKLTSMLRLIKSGEAEAILTSGLCIALKNGHQDVTRHLLKNGANPNTEDRSGNIPAHWVLQPGLSFDVDYVTHELSLLLSFGADFSTCNDKGMRAIQLAARSKYDHLLEAFAGLIGESKFQEDSRTLKPSLLQCAVIDGSDSAVRFLVHSCQQINPADHQHVNGTSLMGLAAMRQTDIALRILSRKGLPIEALSRDGSSVLFHAIQNESDEPFKLVLEGGTVDNSTRSDGRKAIHEAVRLAALSKLTGLLKAGHDPNTKDSRGMSPLHLAMLDYDAQMSESTDPVDIILLEAKTKVDSQDVVGMTALMKCLESWAGVQKYDSAAMFRWRDSLLTNAECLMEQNLHPPDLLLTDQNNRTAMHFLCQGKITYKSFALVKTMVIRGVSLEARDAFGVSPFESLFLTCVDRKRSDFLKSIDLKTKKEILQYAADKSLASLNDLLSFGVCPLSFALTQGDNVAVDILLAKSEVSVDIRASVKYRLNSIETAAA